MKSSNIKWMVKVAMLSAVSVILMLFEFPIPFIAPSFYELDFSEVPVLLGGFALGPLAGVVIECIKILLNLLVNGSVTYGVGEFANLVVGIAFVLPVCLLYKKHKTKKAAIYGLIVGGAVMVVFGSLLNAFVLIPAYAKAFKMPIDAFVKMGTSIYPSINSLWKLVLFCTAPFNILKVILVSIVTIIIYKPLSPVLKK